MELMNFFFAHSWLLGELGETGHVQRSFPKLMVVGLDLDGGRARAGLHG